MQTGDRPRLWGFAILAVAFIEIAAHIAIRARVPTEEHWQDAAAFVESSFEDGDRIVSAPDWADPLVRHYFGMLIPVADAAASDLAGVRRLWVVSVRGARSPWAPDRPADQTKAFGRVLVERWSLREPTVIYDFVSHVREATVELIAGGQVRPCPFGKASIPRAGLDRGAMTPPKRFNCDRARRRLWVGPTVMEDLDFRPRRCIWQHPAGVDPVRVTFGGVPTGDRLVFHAGLYYRDERMEEHGPVLVRVLVDGEPVGQLLHRDGDGWLRLELDMPDAEGDTVTVTVETTADKPARRSLCWSGTVQGTPAP